MGIVLAREEHERRERSNALGRTSEHLDRCRPEYFQDDAVLLHYPTDSEVGAAQAADLDYESILEVAHSRLRAAATTGSRWTAWNCLRGKQLLIDSVDARGRSALYLAAEFGHASMVRFLVRRDADVHHVDDKGWTPLHVAAFHGQIECVDALITNQADVNACDKHDCAPLTFAASSPKLYLAELASKSDRLKQAVSRRSKFAQQQKLHSKRNKRGVTAVLDLNPLSVWKYYPNRLELMLMEILVKADDLIVDTKDRWLKTPLMYAARFGRTCAASRLLHAKADLTLKDKDGCGALFHAACNEHLETAELLLRAAADIHSEDHKFRTPLHGALEAGDEDMANLLLKAEACVNAYDCLGVTPIMLAMKQHNRRLFTSLIEKRSELDVLDTKGRNVLIYAIDTNMLGDVLTQAPERAKPIVKAMDPRGRNALHHAILVPQASASHRAVIRLANVDLMAATRPDCNGNTPVHLAAELGHLDSLRFFMDNFESLDFRNLRGETPLHYAAHCGHLACVVALLHDKDGVPCDAGAVDMQGRTLLMHACESGHLDLVNLLLVNRDGEHQEFLLPALDVNAADVEGATALLIAAREGHWQLIPSLVLAGANLSAKDKDGFTALHWAAIEDEALTASCLLDFMPDAENTDGKGWTALMHAAAQGCDEVVQLLVDRKANLDACNWDGDTALQLCTRRRDQGAYITKEILTDGVLDHTVCTSHAVAASGYFMVSILGATDLYIEGQMSDINPYVCLQFCAREGSTPQVAYTSCSMRETSPEWHEVFRFDTESLDPSSFLVAWVLTAPGDTPADVLQADLDLHKGKPQKSASSSQDAAYAKPDFNTALSESLESIRRKADAKEALDVRKMRNSMLAIDRASVPTSDLQDPKPNQRDSVPVDERRWLEVANLRQLLQRSGCDIPEPLAPRSHLPLGCVVVRFRHLRATVWHTEPTIISRKLRLGCRGRLHMEIDFRPKFFAATSRYELPAEEEEEIYGVRVTDDTESGDDEEVSTPFFKEKPGQVCDSCCIDTGLPWMPRKVGEVQTAAMHQRFMQITVWAQQVLRARQQLTPGAEQKLPRGKTDSIQTPRQRLKNAFKVIREPHPIDDGPQDDPLTLQRSSGERLPQFDKSISSFGIQSGNEESSAPKLPALKSEPWLEDLVAGSRFF